MDFNIGDLIVFKEGELRGQELNYSVIITSFPIRYKSDLNHYQYIQARHTETGEMLEYGLDWLRKRIKGGFAKCFR